MSTREDNLSVTVQNANLINEDVQARHISLQPTEHIEKDPKGQGSNVDQWMGSLSAGRNMLDLHEDISMTGNISEELDAMDIRGGLSLMISDPASFVADEPVPFVMNGDFTNHSAVTIYGHGTLVAKGDFENYGAIVIQNSISVVTEGRFENYGALSIHGDASLITRGDFANYGAINVQDDLSIAAGGSLANRGSISAQGDASLSAAEEVESTGSVYAQGDVFLTANTFANTEQSKKLMVEADGQAAPPTEEVHVIMADINPISSDESIGASTINRHVTVLDANGNKSLMMLDDLSNQQMTDVGSVDRKNDVSSIVLDTNLNDIPNLSFPNVAKEPSGQGALMVSSGLTEAGTVTMGTSVGTISALGSENSLKLPSSFHSGVITVNAGGSVPDIDTAALRTVDTPFPVSGSDHQLFADAVSGPVPSWDMLF